MAVPTHLSPDSLILREEANHPLPQPPSLCLGRLSQSPVALDTAYPFSSHAPKIGADTLRWKLSSRGYTTLQTVAEA